MTHAPSELLTALRDTAATLAEVDTMQDIGPHLTCSEADALAKMMVLLGHFDAGAALLKGHARGDEDPALVDTDDIHHHLATGDGFLTYAHLRALVAGVE